MKTPKIHIACILLLCIGANLLWSSSSEGMTAKQAYFKAETCYKKLRNSRAKMKYRDNWLNCIEKFQLVYSLDPTGPWAPAGLYMSGKLYQQLAKYSQKKSDHQEARDLFERNTKRFPNSRYRDKAAAEIRALSSSTISKNAPTKTQSASSRMTARHIIAWAEFMQRKISMAKQPRPTRPRFRSNRAAGMYATI